MTDQKETCVECDGRGFYVDDYDNCAECNGTGFVIKSNLSARMAGYQVGIPHLTSTVDIMIPNIKAKESK